MAAKKKGPGKGRGPSSRPASPAKRTTVPKPPAPKATAPRPPAAGTPAGAPKPAATTPKASRSKATGAALPATPATSSGTATSAGATKSAAPGPPAPAAKSTGGAKMATPAKSAGAGKAAGGPKSPAAATKPASARKAGAVSKQDAPGKGGTTRTTPTRQERLAAAEAARRRQRIRNKALLAGGVALLIFVVGFVITSDRKERNRQAAQFTTASCTFDRTSDPDDGPGRNHTPTPSYKVNPPAGGNHTPQAAPAGIYTDANLPIDGQIVHAMEHGYVVFWYRPDLDEQSLAQLRDLANRHARDVLMVPRPSIDVPVAATAWHARILCRGLEVDTFERFVDTFVNKGPEKVAH